MNIQLSSLTEITDNHSLKSFDCGVDELNTFFRYYAKKNELLSIGRTTVGIDINTLDIVGFFTLCNAQLFFEEIPQTIRSKLPKYPVPCIRIARFAVDIKYQKKGIGKILLREALKKIVYISKLTGIKFIIVNAKETSASFYEKYGFLRLEDSSNTVILPIETVLQLFI